MAPISSKFGETRDFQQSTSFRASADDDDDMEKASSHGQTFRWQKARVQTQIFFHSNFTMVDNSWSLDLLIQ